MRSRILMVVVAAVLVTLTAPALAQQPGRGPGGERGRGGPGGGTFGFGGGGFISRLALLRIPEIQRELELVDEQLTAIRQLQEELGGGRGRGGPQGERGRGGPGGERRPGNPGDRGASSQPVPVEWFFVQQAQQPGQGRRGGQPLSEEDRARFEQERLERTRQEVAKLKEILLPHQYQRLWEIYIQQAGAAALQDEEVAKELNISEAQKREMASIRQANQESMQAQIRELFQGGGGGGDAARTRMNEIRRANDEKLYAVLNTEQRQRLDQLKGKPFDLPEGALLGGRGGPGGGGPGGNRGPGGQPGQRRPPNN